MLNLFTNPKTITLIIVSLALSFIFAVDFVTSSSINLVLNISSSSQNFLSVIVDYLDFGVPFGAGVLAAFNPCGIVMLPVYLALYLHSEDLNTVSDFSTIQRKLLSSAVVIICMGSGFFLLFITVAFLVSLSTEIVGNMVPYVSIVLSIIIIYFGIAEFFDKGNFSSTITRLSSKIGNPNKVSPISFILFGISYGVASIGCALPIFLSIVAKSLNATSFYKPIIDFSMYSLGMISVVTLLTLLTLLSSNSMKRVKTTIRKRSHLLFGVFLTSAGTFMLVYWVSDLKLSGF